MTFGLHAQQRVLDLARRTTAKVVIRKVTRVPGSMPAPNPPTLSNVTVLSPVTSGATSISITGQVMSGRILAGDRVVIAGHQTGYPVSADVTLASGSATLQLTMPVGANISAGTAVGFSWACDTEVPSFDPRVSQQFRGDPAISVVAVSVQIPFTAMPVKPSLSDVLLLGGTPHSIESVMPIYTRGVQTAWQISARG